MKDLDLETLGDVAEFLAQHVFHGRTLGQRGATGMAGPGKGQEENQRSPEVKDVKYFFEGCEVLFWSNRCLRNVDITWGSKQVKSLCQFFRWQRDGQLRVTVPDQLDQFDHFICFDLRWLGLRDPLWCESTLMQIRQLSPFCEWDKHRVWAMFPRVFPPVPTKEPTGFGWK